MTDFWNSRRVLVTGGHGFLGKHVVGMLEDLGAEVRAPTRAEADLTKLGGLLRICNEEKRPDVVFHLAANCGGIGLNRDRPGELFRDNMQMGMNVIHQCMLWLVPKLVTVGTVCSYPETPPRIPFREEDLFAGYPEPTNAAYGIAKRALLVMGQAYRKQYGLKAIHLVLANLYGPGDHCEPAKSHVIPGLVRRMMTCRDNRQPLYIWGDGTPTRDFLYVTDAARALVLAAEKYDDPEPLNVGTGVETSIARLAELIGREARCEDTFRWDSMMPNGQPRRCVDASRARELLGWQPEVGFDEGIARTVEYWEGERRKSQGAHGAKRRER